MSAMSVKKKSCVVLSEMGEALRRVKTHPVTIEDVGASEKRKNLEKLGSKL